MQQSDTQLAVPKHSHSNLISKSRQINEQMTTRRDMNLIRDYLYLGCLAAEQASLASLQELGITHVVQVGANAYMQPSHGQALEYCCVAAQDLECVDLLAKLREQEVHSFISNARSNGGVVLVHCLAGISRSATTVISWLMMEEGLPFEGALADVISRRPCVAPNRGFCDQLTIFQDRCGSRLENYTPSMFKDMKEEEEISLGLWIALLQRARAAARQMNGTDQAPGDNADDTGRVMLSLGDFAQRLEERKRRGLAGEYKGFPPPVEEDEIAP